MKLVMCFTSVLEAADWRLRISSACAAAAAAAAAAVQQHTSIKSILVPPPATPLRTLAFRAHVGTSHDPSQSRCGIAGLVVCGLKRCTLQVTRHSSRITRHTSHVTRHTSHVSFSRLCILTSRFVIISDPTTAKPLLLVNPKPQTPNPKPQTLNPKP